MPDRSGMAGMSAERKPFRREGEDQRRRELVDATLACIAELGMERTTVREIAIRAGVTPGLIRHYFAGKDELVLAAYRRHVEELAAHAEKAVEEAGSDPVSRLSSLIVGTLSSPVVDQINLSLWAGFIEMVRTNAAMAEVHREGYQHYRKLSEALIGDALEAEGRRSSMAECERFGIMLNALIDGLWLEGSLSPAEFQDGSLAAIGLEAASAITGIKLKYRTAD
jgi:TetR/AcrR family transcriptional regulator, transcriptional repressor of bet genes